MKFFLFAFISIGAIMCNSPSGPAGDDGLAYTQESAEAIVKRESPREYDQSARQPNAPEKEVGIEEKVIKNGNMSVEVDDLQKSKNDIDAILSEHGAHYQNENYHSSDYASTYNLSIRIPSDRFEDFVEGVEGIGGFIEAKNISARNVTEEYIDLTMRLENSQKYLDQYNQILKQARTIKEILEVQEKIRVIEQEIEARKGRLNYLDNQVSMSTLQLTLTQRHASDVRTKGFFAKAGDALVDGFRLLQSTLIFLLNIWPYLIILALLIVFRKRLVFWRRRKMD